MALQRWNPMYEVLRMHEAMSRRWRDSTFPSNGAESRSWSIPLDIVEEGQELLLRASLPGVKPDDIHVTIEDHVLTIKAEMQAEEKREEGGYLMRERRTGAFHRLLRLPETVDTDKARTLYENGVLTVAVPKAESKKAKRLEVTVGKASEGETK